jgi:O-antigen ligase
MFAASRIAFAAIIGATIIQLLIYYSWSDSIRTIGYSALLIAIMLPNADLLTHRLQGKHTVREETGVFDSRSVKWNARIDEFKKSPICGVGFAAVDINGKDFSARSDKHVEPGNSWLAVLSMTGLMGMIPFLIIIYRTCKVVVKLPRDKKVFYSGMLSFVLIHMMAEGYILSAGSFLCAITWLIIGCIFNTQFDKRIQLKAKV